jgi:hypothetical protein
MSSVTLTPDTITFPDTDTARASKVRAILARLEGQAVEIAALNTAYAAPAAKPEGVKRGVWVDGKLRLQTRDETAIDEYAAKKMAERHSVWVAPIGSFVTR